MQTYLTTTTAAAALGLALFASPAVAGEAAVGAAEPAYSVWMAESIMSRGQGIMTGQGGSSELLQAGITQRALGAVAMRYPAGATTPRITQYLEESAASVVPFTSNATYDALSYPMDRLSTGNALIGLASTSDNETASTEARTAADALRQSIDLNRRNDLGGLWYYVYPNWSYLDGMWSLAPFYTHYALDAAFHGSVDGSSENATTEALDDMVFQLDLLWNHTYNATSGLLAHGYDASRTAVWANNVTGASPHVWGRSLGWYSMALVDTLQILPPTGPACKYRDSILLKWRILASGLLQAVDAATGGWWQVMDEPGRAGNYIESSGTAMFAYALLKSARLGYLPAEDVMEALTVGTRAQKYLTDAFVVRDANGTLSYNGTVAVCSLNSTATYEYYVGQPINYNSVLGSAAYILASLEVEH
ncbi:glycoside hydrolase family 105 protein [Hypoxylon rubiginosum]|uniref:Glycoside hydrolase family 105 protein n=1 Tax=Hypoxylon rubiginosum TaxID=110542 RepID=A0ACC0DAA2_9PEZI|nr:glycoside hydrolase family 105 protein [Hypoxylon rubiginosum]